MKYKAINDGVDHINIYSKGRTELGRLLSNFAATPFEVPDDGAFVSIEAYWYWLLLPEGAKGRDTLPVFSGFAAKKRGRELLRLNQHILTRGVEEVMREQLKPKIINAFHAKVAVHPNIRKLLAESTLPFAHYYVFNGVEKAAGHEWQLESWEYIRQELKKFNSA